MRQPSSEWHFMSDYIKRAPRVSWKFAVFKGLRDFWYLHIVIYFCDEFRLEEKKRQKKPEIKDPKLQELQERLEARKAGKWDTWTNFISSLYTIIHNSIIYTSWSAFSSRSYFFSSGSNSILLFSYCFPSHICIAFVFWQNERRKVKSWLLSQKRVQLEDRKLCRRRRFVNSCCFKCSTERRLTTSLTFMACLTMNRCQKAGEFK